MDIGDREIEAMYNQIKVLDQKSDDRVERLARLESRVESWGTGREKLSEKIAQLHEQVNKMQIELAQLKARITIYGSIAIMVISIAVNFLSKLI